VAFSPDGTLMAATGSHDNTVKLWRVSDGILLRTLEGHTDVVTSVAFSRDGTLLATGSWDKTVRLWRVTEGNLLRTLTGHVNQVYSVAFSPDGTWLASACGNTPNSVLMWGVAP